MNDQEFVEETVAVLAVRAGRCEDRLREAEQLVEDWMSEHGGSGPTMSLLNRTRAFLGSPNTQPGEVAR